VGVAVDERSDQGRPVGVDRRVPGLRRHVGAQRRDLAVQATQADRLAAELGLAYAAICVVDNLANGIGSGPLEIIELEAARATNALQLHDGLATVLPQLGAVGP
jgi:hypothetical protein